MMRPIPSFPWRRWWRWPPESQQSSPNNASNRQLKVSCGLLPSLVLKNIIFFGSLQYGTSAKHVFSFSYFKIFGATLWYLLLLSDIWYYLDTFHFRNILFLDSKQVWARKRKWNKCEIVQKSKKKEFVLESLETQSYTLTSLTTANSETNIRVSITQPVNGFITISNSTKHNFSTTSS